MKIKITTVLAAMAVGAVAGYLANDGGERIGLKEKEPPARVKSRISDIGADASIKSLRMRIAHLEKLLSEKEKEIPVKPPVVRESHRERMARLKKEDPARYIATTNRIAAWRRSRAKTARDRIDFLSSIDISQMSPEAQKVHEELRELIAKREDIEAQMHQPELDDDARHKLFEQLRSSGAKMQELNAKERENLLSETARNLGFEGDDAAEIVATIKEVVEATESGWGRGFGHGRGRRPPSGGHHR